jgi:hypothetical protein
MPARHGSAVAVLRGWPDLRPLLEAHAGQVLSAALAEGLSLLWCVDFGQAHLYLFIGSRLATAGGQGVAVADTDDEAEEGGNHPSESKGLFAGERSSPLLPIVGWSSCHDCTPNTFARTSTC